MDVVGELVKATRRDLAGRDWWASLMFVAGFCVLLETCAAETKGFAAAPVGGPLWRTARLNALARLALALHRDANG